MGCAPHPISNLVAGPSAISRVGYRSFSATNLRKIHEAFQLRISSVRNGCIDKPVLGGKAASHWYWSRNGTTQKNDILGLAFPPLAIGTGYFAHRRAGRFGPKISRNDARCARVAGGGGGAGHHVGGVLGHRGSAPLVGQARGALGRPRRSVQLGGGIVVAARQLLRKFDDAGCVATSDLAFLAVFGLGGRTSHGERHSQSQP